MNAIHIQSLSLSYGDKPLLSDLQLSVHVGEWVVILGRSGCGKSTLLKTIAGLDHGATQIAGDIQSNITNLSYMAQQDCLLPWLKVVDNVQLNEHLHSKKNAQTRTRALELLSQVGLLEHADKAPYELSGGQRQRVALARTLMQTSDVILMDEPFSAVDAITRWELQRLSTELLADKAVILITHDPLEAVRLADTIYVMRDGGLSEAFKPNGIRPRLDAHQTQPDLQQQLLAVLS